MHPSASRASLHDDESSLEWFCCFNCLFLPARVLDCGRERCDGSEQRGAGLKLLKVQPYMCVCERGQMSAVHAHLSPRRPDGL